MTHQKNTVVALLMCGTALPLCTTAGALAQDVVSLDPIEVRREDPLGDAADQASSVYVADAEIDRASMGDLKDLFAGIASVSVGGAIPLTQKIYVNGVDMLNLAVTVDGVAQNNRIFHHASANAFDPGMMKYVRVDPGVAPADAGFEALAGAVSMETIDANDILEDGETFGGQARLSYSDNGDIFGTSLTLAQKTGGFELLGYAKYVSGGEYTDGEGDVENGTETDLQIGLIKAAYEADAGHRFEFSAQQMADVGTRNAKANFGSTSAATYLYEATRNVVSLKYENTQAVGLWDPEISLGYSSTEIFKPEDYDSNGITDTLSATIQNTFHLANGTDITTGVDYISKTGTYSTASTGVVSGAESFDNVGIFTQARFEFSPGFDISTGLRIDHQNFTDTDGGEYSNTGLSTNISATYEVSPSWTVRGGYSSVFGGIPIEDNFLFSDDWDYSGLVEVTRGENFILGADYGSGNLTFGAEIFRTRLNDVRTSDWDRTSGSYVAGHGTYESSGYNLSATYDWTSGFARLTFSDTQALWNGETTSNYAVLDSGTALGQVLAIEMQQELPDHNLVVGGAIEAARGMNVYDVQYATDYSYAGYAVLDLFAEYHVPNVNDLVVRVTVDNVFDAKYADRATYGAEYGLETLAEPGRTISLIATVEF